jgi:SAM-dependent methyltransferase
LAKRVCPACRHDGRHTVLYTRRLEETFEYVACEACGTLYLVELPSPAFLKALYQHHEDLSNNDPQPDVVSTPQYSPVSRMFRPHLWPLGNGCGRDLLDIGCSSGRHVADFRRRGWRVAGIDIDEAAIARARLAMPDGDFRAGDPEDVDFEAHRFDLIRLDNTLEHVPAPETLLARARLWLRDGGRIIIYVPHGRSASIQLFGELAINIWPPYHLQLFSRAGLRRLLENVGFKSVTCWGYTPRGVLGSSFVLWRRCEPRVGAAPGAARTTRWIELMAWPLVTATRRDEELIGVGRA